MDETAPLSSYRSYWSAWLFLLFVTIVMVFSGSAPVLIAGMLVKASVIALWFMHLRNERRDFTLLLVAGTLVTGLLLFALIAPDGAAMGNELAR